MNTAFSKAYLIESLGQKGGILRNRAYIDSSWLDVIGKVASDFVLIDLSGGSVTLRGERGDLLRVNFDDVLYRTIRGIDSKILSVSEFIVLPSLEGDTTHFPMDPQLLDGRGRWPRP